ncbi:MAG: S1C family serine protease [Chitinophagaceae bacterium]
MEDILLQQAIERYLDGTMLPAEKAYFEELRQNTHEIDQMVVEHSMFLHQMDNFSGRKNLQLNLSEVHTKLLSMGDINEGGEQTAKSKVVSIWNRYKKVTTIAAAVGGGIALMISSLVAYFNPISPDITKLGVQLKQQQNQIAVLNSEIIKSKIPTKAEIKGGGSSFLIDGKGYLVTNAHVLDGATYASVFSEDGKEYNAIIAYKNNESDLAILKIEDEEFEPIKNLPYGIKKSNADLGDEIFTIGFPNFPRTDVVYNVGYLSSIKGFNGDTVSCQIQMNANHGNSGGPVFNKRGEVIGVLSTKLSKADGVSFAIKSKNIYQLVDDFKKSDSTATNIKISTSTSINGDERTSQVKKIESYVYMVKAYRK